MARTAVMAAIGMMFWSCGLSAGAAPVVFRVSDPVGADETVLLFGDCLGPTATAEGWVLPDAPVSGPPDATADRPLPPGDRLEVLQASEMSAKVLLPATWPTGMYAIRLRGSGGDSLPVYLNRTEPWWWLGEPGHVAAPRGTIRVFGKNLGVRPCAWLKGPGDIVALSRVEKPAAVAPTYQAEFVLPETIVPGDYQLWVHNGHGGPLGFGRPLAVRVERPAPWPDTRYDVRQCGATGDGVADDTAAVQSALAKAGESGGGQVYFPHGRYKITAKLVIPPKTVVCGEKRELVWLIVPKDLPEIETVLAGSGDFEVRDLSIVAQTPRRLIVCPDVKSAYNMPWGHVPADKLGHNAHLVRLRLHHLRYAHRVQGKDDPRRREDVGPSTVVLAGPDMEMTDCEVVSPGMPLVLIESRHGRICGNRLETGRNGWYGLWGAEETVFENNNIQGRDLEGSYGGVQGKATRLLIAGNRFHAAYGCEREALTFDTPYHPTWMGRVAKVTGRSLTAAEYDGTPKTWKPDALVGQVCLIAHGKGLGQYVRIMGNSETTITLAEPWAVPPDVTSHLVVRVDKSDVVIAGNRFADASAAVQLYAQSFGFIVDGNTAERTGGMYAIGWDARDQRQRRRYSTCFFNQWLNNRLTEGFIYDQGAFPYGVLGPCASGGTLDPPTVVAVGNVVRNNRLEDHQTTGAMYFARHPLTVPDSKAGYFGRDTIIEKNLIADTPLAIDVYPRYIDTLIRGNAVRGSLQPLRDDGTNTWVHPAERLQYQCQALQEVLGADVVPRELAAAVAKLAQKPAMAAQTQAAAAQLHRTLWKRLAQVRSGPLPPGALAALVGLHYEFAPSSPLVAALAARGKPGRSEVAIRARTEPWSPEITLQANVVPPSGWQNAENRPVVAPPGVLVNLSAGVQVPEQDQLRDIRELPVRIVATLDGVTLSAEDRFDVSARELLDWLVLGPFPGTGKEPRQPPVLPAESKLDAGATYDGLGAKVAWQPVTLPNKYLHFDHRWKPQEPAAALALACLRAEKAVWALIRFHARGALEANLNGQVVAKIDLPGGGRDVRVELRPGNNLLLCKSWSPSGMWEIAVEAKPLTPGADSGFSRIPVAELPKLEVLRPQRAAAPPRGGLEHTAGVAWREILRDDFQGTRLGPRWRPAAGQWTVRDGALQGQQRAFLALVEQVPIPLRIEYDASSAAPADLSCSWLRDPADSQSGCLMAFASGNGSRIQFDGAVLAQSDTELAKGTPNRWHHVVAQIQPDATCEVYADGQLLLRAKLDVRPKATAHPGLWTWGEGSFDNVRIFSGPEVTR